jgi:Holliday junction resolvase RusA-like endonuclease
MKDFIESRADLEKITGPVNLELTFYTKGARQFDIDNRLKSFIDSFEHVLIEDDNNVKELSARKNNHCTEDKTVLIIEQFEES